MAPSRQAHGRPGCARARACASAPRAHHRSDLGALKPWRAVETHFLQCTFVDSPDSRRSWPWPTKWSRRAAHAGARARARASAPRAHQSSDLGALKPWRAFKIRSHQCTFVDARVARRSWPWPTKRSRRAAHAGARARARASAFFLSRVYRLTCSATGTVASLGRVIRKKVRGFWAVVYDSGQWGTWTGSEPGGWGGGVVILGGQGPSGWGGVLGGGVHGQGPSRLVGWCMWAGSEQVRRVR